MFVVYYSNYPDERYKIIGMVDANDYMVDKINRIAYENEYLVKLISDTNVNGKLLQHLLNDKTYLEMMNKII